MWDKLPSCLSYEVPDHNFQKPKATQGATLYLNFWVQKYVPVWICVCVIVLQFWLNSQTGGRDIISSKLYPCILLQKMRSSKDLGSGVSRQFEVCRKVKVVFPPIKQYIMMTGCIVLWSRHCKMPSTPQGATVRNPFRLLILIQWITYIWVVDSYTWI